MVVLTEPFVYCSAGVVLGIANLDTGKFPVTSELIFDF
jgi:hypothetical protein